METTLVKIIFWNVHRRDLSEHVCSLASSTNADVIILIENRISDQIMLRHIQDHSSKDFELAAIASEFSLDRFHCFCRNPKLDLSEVHSGFRMSYRKLTIGNQMSLLAIVHGVDIRNNDAETRQEFAQSIATDMRFVAEQQGTSKFILIGDFNLNPFDRGMNLAAGLNAMMTKACITRGIRGHFGQDYDFYYNPMWNLFGDLTKGPAGTIYNRSNQGQYGWSMLDQVILHHSIIDLFEDVEILTHTGSQSLMDQHGHPDEKNASDHFPIMVSLRETNNV